jgi:hypothetical protein
MFLRILVLFVASKIPTCRPAESKSSKALTQCYQINALPDHLPASKIAYLPLLMQPPEKAWGRSYKKKYMFLERHA